MRHLLLTATVSLSLSACYGDGDLDLFLDRDGVDADADSGRIDRDTRGAPDDPDGPDAIDASDDTGAATTPDADSGGPEADAVPDVEPGDDWPPDWVALEDQVVALVNQRRADGARCGGQTFGPAAAIASNPALQRAARDHADDMATRGYFDHVAPDGSDPFDRIAAAGYSGGYPQGENIAAGYRDAETVVAGWMDSPGHCANIMEPGYGAIGVGFVFDDRSEMGSYWVQTFGARP